MNDRARGITQTGSPGVESFGDIGLNGLDQVVGVADSGVDDLSCFFIDDNGEHTPRSDKEDPQTYAGRRKIVQYVDHADDRDDYAGHGSHVCGSITGKSTFRFCEVKLHDFDKCARGFVLVTVRHQ